MKKIYISLNVILVIFFGYKILSLNAKLERTPLPAKISPQFNIREIFRPDVIKEFEFEKIFDTREPADSKSDKSIQVLNPDGINQIFDKDVILRLKGIITSKDLSFAVLKIVKKNKEVETIKLLKGENFRGYLLEKIFKDYVELRGDFCR